MRFEGPRLLDPQTLGIVGRSAAFVACYQQLRRLARSKAPLLIEGEMGTGKECAARYLHYVGPRCDGPFVPLNCGALPESMLENELFGHIQGAYTDARKSSEGLVRRAEHGTLLLDEVDALFAWLERQPWPGNVRELQNCLHRAFLLTDGDVIEDVEMDSGDVRHRLELLDFDTGYDSLKQSVTRDFERQYLEPRYCTEPGAMSRRRHG